MDKRTLISSAALLGFVLMLVGTSKPPSHGPSPAPMPPTTLDGGGGEGGGDGGGAADAGASDAATPPPATDAGRTPRSVDAGTTPPGPVGRLELPPLWGDVGVPPGGKIDAVRLVYAGAEASDVQGRLVAALTAKGWTLAQATDPLAPPGSAKPMTFSRRGQRLAVRITSQDDAVIVSLNLL